MSVLKKKELPFTILCTLGVYFFFICYIATFKPPNHFTYSLSLSLSHTKNTYHRRHCFSARLVLSSILVGLCAEPGLVALDVQQGNQTPLGGAVSAGDKCVAAM